MDDLLNDEVYYEKLEEECINVYIEKIQCVLQEFLTEKDNYDIVYIQNGINTIMHVMFNIFINTKNIDISVYYGKLSITYYVEFLNQINTNSVNTFISLTLKDAILFVYKKTLFNLNSQYIKRYKNKNDDKLFEIIFTITKIINRLHIYNNYTIVKYKTIINQLININTNIDIDIIEKIIILLINNKIELIKIVNFISLLSKKKCYDIKTKNIYSFLFLPNYTNKSFINHLLSL